MWSRAHKNSNEICLKTTHESWQNFIMLDMLIFHKCMSINIPTALKEYIKKSFPISLFHFIHLLASFTQPHRAINKIKPICQNLMTNIAANVEWEEKLKCEKQCKMKKWMYSLHNNRRHNRKTNFIFFLEQKMRVDVLMRSMSNK